MTRYFLEMDGRYHPLNCSPFNCYPIRWTVVLENAAKKLLVASVDAYIVVVTNNVPDKVARFDGEWIWDSCYLGFVQSGQ